MIDPTLESFYSLYKKLKDNKVITQFMSDYHSFDEKQVARLNYYSKQKIRAIGLLVKIHQNSDSVEVLSAIKNFWFELRSEWIRHNSINNYTMVYYGNADEVSVVQSAFIAFLLQEVETLIPEKDLEKMNEIMIEVQGGM